MLLGDTVEDILDVVTLEVLTDIDCQALPGIPGHHGQHARFLSVEEFVLDEVHAPVASADTVCSPCDKVGA